MVVPIFSRYEGQTRGGPRTEILSDKMVRLQEQTAMKDVISLASLNTVGNGKAVLEALRNEKKLWQILQLSESCSSGQSS